MKKLLLSVIPLMLITALASNSVHLNTIYAQNQTTTTTSNNVTTTPITPTSESTQNQTQINLQQKAINAQQNQTNLQQKAINAQQNQTNLQQNQTQTASKSKTINTVNIKALLDYTNNAIMALKEDHKTLTEENLFKIQKELINATGGVVVIIPSDALQPSRSE